MLHVGSHFHYGIFRLDALCAAALSVFHIILPKFDSLCIVHIYNVGQYRLLHLCYVISVKSELPGMVH